MNNEANPKGLADNPGTHDSKNIHAHVIEAIELAEIVSRLSDQAGMEKGLTYAQVKDICPEALMRVRNKRKVSVRQFVRQQIADGRVQKQVVMCVPAPSIKATASLEPLPSPTRRYGQASVCGIHTHSKAEATPLSDRQVKMAEMDKVLVAYMQEHDQAENVKRVTIPPKLDIGALHGRSIELRTPARRPPYLVVIQHMVHGYKSNSKGNETRTPILSDVLSDIKDNFDGKPTCEAESQTYKRRNTGRAGLCIQVSDCPGNEEASKPAIQSAIKWTDKARRYAVRQKRQNKQRTESFIKDQHANPRMRQSALNRVSTVSHHVKTPNDIARINASYGF